MNETREDDHDEYGEAEFFGMGKDEDHDSLSQQEDRLSPETASHSILGISLIREEPAESTCEEIHPAEEGSNGSGTLRGKLKRYFEVARGGVVHGEFNPEAAGILDEQ